MQLLPVDCDLEPDLDLNLEKVEEAPSTYSWAHVHTKHYLWKLTPGEGLYSFLELPKIRGSMSVEGLPRKQVSPYDYNLLRGRLLTSEQKCLSFLDTPQSPRKNTTSIVLYSSVRRHQQSHR